MILSFRKTTTYSRYFVRPCGLVHTVRKNPVIEIFLHFGDIYNATVSKFLEFGIVDVRTVRCNNFIMIVMTGSEHERIICSSRGKLNITENTLVGMYDRVNLYTTLLLTCLWMTSHPLEYGIGKQRDSREVNDS